ncbi:MAG: radical SAM protein [Caldilinea sp. CFX5]|nr:radical SAM protein [Caldilinea sp. CFX5]
MASDRKETVPVKILLLNPNRLTPPIFPCGLEYTAEFLHQQGHAITVLDLNVTQDLTPVAEQELVLVGVRNLDSGANNQAFELDKTRQLIAEIRRHYKGVIAIAGAAVNLVPEAIRDYLQVEYALVSKGFGALQQFVSQLAQGIEPPRVLTDYTEFIHGTFRRNFVDKGFYQKDAGRIGVATKFGCPIGCDYCVYPAVDGQRMRARAADEVVEEIGHLVAAGVKRIFFVDAQFNIPVKHALTILQRLLDQGIAVDWDGFHNPHPKALTTDYVRCYQAFGNQHIYLGIDSLSDPVLKAMRKGFTVADIEQAVDRCRAVGLDVSCSLLFGHPAETVATVTETFQRLDALQFHYVDVSPAIRIYPKTALYQTAVTQGLVQAGDPLLRPLFYPVAEPVAKTIQQLAGERVNCHRPGYLQYVDLRSL